MQCPKCNTEATINASNDLNNPDTSIDLLVTCDECDWSAYTFVHLDDLVQEDL